MWKFGNKWNEIVDNYVEIGDFLVKKRHFFHFAGLLSKKMNAKNHGFEIDHFGNRKFVRNFM